VIGPDGRRAPFDPDRISQALFAATEELGRPNAFLARELADAVLHFIAQEADGEPIPVERVADLVGDVVRGLDQPALARAVEERRQRRRRDPAQPAAADREGAFTFSAADAPDAVARAALRAYSLRAIFSRDLAAARQDGLLVLAGLETPAVLGSCLVDGATACRDVLGLWQALHQGRGRAGQGLVIDGPEWAGAAAGWEALCRAVGAAGGLAGRAVVVNANAAEPPAWAQQVGHGPLFPHAQDTAGPSRIDAVRTLVDVGFPPAAEGAVRLDWHLRADDFSAGPALELLTLVAGRALDGAAVAFVLDRPRRPPALAEGMDRRHAGVLMEVGLDLPAFLGWADVAGDAQRFLEKLPSLARMAVSVGAQRRRFLRTREAEAGLARGFLLDRARLVVTPLGLDDAVRMITGAGAAASPAALDIARQIVRLLTVSIGQAGQLAHLDACLDSPGPGLRQVVAEAGQDRQAEGLSCADARQTPQKQLQAAGKLHAIAGGGTAMVSLPQDQGVTAADLVQWLHYAWKRTEVVRVGFRPGPVGTEDGRDG
jgi:hypothetical protein